MEEFMDAAIYWDLESLYADVALIKQLELTDWEKTCLRGLLCGCHPEAIASKIYWTASSLRVELSRRLYPYISTLVGKEKIAWHRVTKLLEEAGYKYPVIKKLKRELININSLADSSNSQIIKASAIISNIEKQLTNNNFNLSNLDISTESEVEKIILMGEANSKQHNFINSIDLYQKALMLNPLSTEVIIRVARCYDRLKSYKNSLFICDFALFMLDKYEYESYSDKNHYKSIIYNFIAGVFHELSLNHYHDDYVKTAFEIYQQSLYFSPNDALVAWNIVDLFISVFKDCPVTLEQQKDYLDRAKKAVYDFKGTAYRPESNFREYREAIISDAENSFVGLDEWWQEQLEELIGL